MFGTVLYMCFIIICYCTDDKELIISLDVNLKFAFELQGDNTKLQDEVTRLKDTIQELE